jgi:hypothetical protein
MSLEEDFSIKIKISRKTTTTYTYEYKEDKTKEDKTGEKDSDPEFFFQITEVTYRGKSYKVGSDIPESIVKSDIIKRFSDILNNTLDDDVEPSQTSTLELLVKKEDKEEFAPIELNKENILKDKNLENIINFKKFNYIYPNKMVNPDFNNPPYNIIKNTDNINIMAKIQNKYFQVKDFLYNYVNDITKVKDILEENKTKLSNTTNKTILDYIFEYVLLHSIDIDTNGKEITINGKKIDDLSEDEMLELMNLLLNIHFNDREPVLNPEIVIYVIKYLNVLFELQIVVKNMKKMNIDSKLKPIMNFEFQDKKFEIETYFKQLKEHLFESGRMIEEKNED